MPRRSSFTVLTLVLFSLLFIIRFIHLTADPPYDLSASGGPYGDPAGYSFNARNKVLYGEWEVDNYNMMYMSYPPHLATFLSFKIFGVGIGQQNLVPILFSFLTLIFFFLILRDQAGETAALIGTGLLGINYLFLMYSRIANRIMPSLFFIILGVFFLLKGKKRRFWNIFAGASFFLALISKSVIFYAVGAVLTGYLIHTLLHSRLRDVFKQIAWIFLGSLAPFLPWLFFIYLPQRDFINSFSQLNVQYLIPPRSLPLILRYFWTRPLILIEKMPIISFLAALFSLVLLFKIVHRLKDASLVEWIILAWFLMGFLYYSIIQQRVMRHYIPHIIPLIFMTAFFAARILSESKRPPPKKPQILFGFVVFLWLIFPVSMVLKIISAKFPNFLQSQASLNLSLVVFSLLTASLLFFLLFFLGKKGGYHISLSLKKTLITFLLLGSTVFQLSSYMGWALNARYQFKEISLDLGKAYDKATLAGLWAPAVCLENTHRAHEYFQGYINDRKDFFEHFGVTHVFTTTAFGENLIFERNFPYIMNRAKLLSRYHIWTVEALLYDVIDDAENGEEGLFEAEMFTQKGNTPRFDPSASQRFAVLSRTKEPSYVALIPSGDPLQEGKFRVTFRMKRQGSGKDLNERMARVDVISEKRARVLAFKDIFPLDLKEATYQDFDLLISLKRPDKVTLRIFSQGNGSFWVDCARVVEAE